MAMSPDGFIVPEKQDDPTAYASMAGLEPGRSEPSSRVTAP